MKRSGLIAACLCLVLGGALAAGEERLVVAPYPAATPWKMITNNRNPQRLWLEWIPADQNEADIKDILTEQIFYPQKGTDPSAFLTDLMRRMVGGCMRVRTNGPKAGTENGYPVAYAQLYCSGQSQMHQDVDVFMKAIDGHDALYVVQREFHRPQDPNGTPGVTQFNADQMAQMKARMGAQAAADRFLVSQVALCPPAGGTGLCASH